MHAMWRIKKKEELSDDDWAYIKDNPDLYDSIKYLYGWVFDEFNDHGDYFSLNYYPFQSHIWPHCIINTIKIECDFSKGSVNYYNRWHDFQDNIRLIYSPFKDT